MLPSASRSPVRVPRIVYEYSLPSVVLVSYLRLFGLARERPETPPLDFESQVVPLLGVSKTQARQHLRDLRLARLLDWRLDPGGQYVFRFFRISEPQIGFPDCEEEDEEESLQIIKPKNHHLLLQEGGFPKTESRNPAAVSAPPGGESGQGGAGLRVTAAAPVDPGEGVNPGSEKTPELPGGRVLGLPSELVGSLPVVQGPVPGTPPELVVSPPVAQETSPGKLPGARDVPAELGSDAHSHFGIQHQPQSQSQPRTQPQARPGWPATPAPVSLPPANPPPPALAPSPPLPPANLPPPAPAPSTPLPPAESPAAPPAAIPAPLSPPPADLPPPAHAPSPPLPPAEPPASNLPAAIPAPATARPGWPEIPAQPPLAGRPRPRPTQAWQPPPSTPGSSATPLALDADGHLPSQFKTLIQDPRFNQIMAWLSRSGVWTDTAIRLSRQVLENELRGSPYAPTRADVLGWITFCYAYRSENKITRSASVLAGNLEANRCCPDELRPKPLCLRCRFTADYCECPEGPQADYPPEFFEYAMINAYTQQIEDYWGVCPTCHHYGCLCVERGYAPVAEDEEPCFDDFYEGDEDEEDDSDE